MVVLEEYEHAKKRGAKIYAELLGFGMGADAYHMTAPDVDGPKRSMKAALRNAGVNADQVQYLNAHGTSTPIGDTLEAHAIRNLFGKNVPVSSTKSMHGHTLGAAGALEAVATVLALQNGIVPPTANYEEPDPACDLDVVPNIARNADLEYAMSNSFAFGGLNAVLAVKRFA